MRGGRRETRTSPWLAPFHALKAAKKTQWGPVSAAVCGSWRAVAGPGASAGIRGGFRAEPALGTLSLMKGLASSGAGLPGHPPRARSWTANC